MAQWISAEFDVQVSKHIFELYLTGKIELGKEKKDLVYIYNFEPTGEYKNNILDNNRKYFEFGVTSNIEQRESNHKTDKTKENVRLIKVFQYKSRYCASKGEKYVKKILGELNLRTKYYKNTECFIANKEELEIIFKKIEDNILI